MTPKKLVPSQFFAIILIIFQLIQISQSKSKIEYRNNLCQKHLSIGLQDNQAANVRKFELYNQLCLDIELPYRTTTLPEYVPDLNFTSPDEVLSYLQRWRGVKFIPSCWSFLQVALCSILIPRFEEDASSSKSARIFRPSTDICNDLVNKNNCKFIERHFGWPPIFNCSDSNLFAKNCTNELRDLKPSFKPEVCHYPLVPSNDSNSWFSDIKGCALNCKFPVVSQKSQYSLELYIKFLCIIGLISTSMAILVFEANRSMDPLNIQKSRIFRVIKRCNIFKFIEYLGWSLQIFVEIACSSGGYALHGLPLVANSCVLSFFLTYLSSILYMFWSMYWAKLCYEKITGKRGKRGKKANEGKEGKDKGEESPSDLKIDPTLNFLSYTVSATLFVTVALLGHIDGNGLYGICTVGQKSILMKTLFDLIPNAIGVIYSNIYFVATLFPLWPQRRTKPGLIRNFYRIVILSSVSIIDLIFKIAAYFYNQSNQNRWEKSIDNYIACSLNLQQLYDHDVDVVPFQECSIDSEPISTLYYFEILARFAPGIVISSWALPDLNFGNLRWKIIKLLEDKENDVPQNINAAHRAIEGTYGQDLDMRRISQLHDLVDMTSISLTPRDVSLQKYIEEATNDNETTGHTSSSLRSTFLQSDHFMTSKRHARQTTKINEVRSRDIINHQRGIDQYLDECNKRQQAGLQPEQQFDQFQNPQNIIPIVQMLFNVFMNQNSFQPPNLARPESHAESEFQFHHGMGGTS